MRVPHWCMLVVTMLLLLCEIAISQLCKSLITMVDGFHTLFILMRMALPQSASIITAPISSLDSPPSLPNASLSSAAFPRPLQAGSPIKPIPGTQTISGGSDTSDQSNPEAPTPVNSHKFSSPKMSPKTQNCGLSFTSSRIQSVGVFISALLLASLCISYFLEIIGFILEPHPVQHPMLLVVVGAVSVLHKMLVFGLNWDQLQDERTWSGKQEKTESPCEVNHKVLAEEDSRGQEESKEIVQSKAQSAVQNVVHSGALVFSNPGTSSIPDAECKTLQQRPEVCCQEESSAAGFKFSDHKDTSKPSSVCKFPPFVETPEQSSRWPVCPLSFILVIRGLFTCLLALINSLVALLITPQFLHSSGACSVLVYLDPALSLLAVVTLVATAVPQVYRYGLLLLQASPQHICVSDVGRRIASVPGVQAVHDLHIWQLTESLMVASVHVHCCTGFPVHRCADVMSGVSEVLHNVGVSCCTVQPEFASCSGCSSGSEGDASPVIHREDPSSPPLPACSLACGKACAGSMCCSLLEEDTQSVLTPPAGDIKEDPQTLVIENTFL